MNPSKPRQQNEVKQIPTDPDQKNTHVQNISEN